MNLFKKLFGEKDKKVLDKKAIYTIEHYPISGRYYPKYDRYYMERNLWTKLIELRRDYRGSCVISTNNEEDSDKIISEFKEQWFKETMRTIEK